MPVDYADIIARAQNEQPEQAAARGGRVASVLHADARGAKPKRKLSRKARAAAMRNLQKARESGLTNARKSASLKKPQATREGNSTRLSSKRNPRMRTTTVAKALTRARSAKRKAALRRLLDKYGPNHRVTLAGGGKKKKAKKAAPRKSTRKKSTRRPKTVRAASRRPKSKLARAVRRAKRRRRVVARGPRGRFTTITKRAAKKRAKKRGQRIAMIVAESPRRRRRSKKRRSSRRRRASEGRRHYRRRFRGALDNPMTGMELGVGMIAGLVGFTVEDVLDRFIAARRGPLAGTAYATQAPLDLVRAGAGIGVAAVPLIAAHFIKIPVLRSALQFFGVGAGLNLAGKGINMLAAMALKDTMAGQRLYAPEIKMRDAMKEIAAQTAGTKTGAAGVPPTGAGALPSAGLGQDMVRAGETLRAHAPAVRALNQHAAAVKAVQAGTATPQQAAVVEQIKREHGASIAALNQHPAELLNKAVATYGAQQLGLAGVPGAPSSSKPLLPARIPFVDKYNWGEQPDAA